MSVINTTDIELLLSLYSAIKITLYESCTEKKAGQSA